MRAVDSKHTSVDAQTTATKGLGASLAVVGRATLMPADGGLPRVVPIGLIAMLPSHGDDIWPDSLDPSVEKIVAPVLPHGRGRRRGRMVDVAYVPAWLLPDPDTVLEEEPSAPVEPDVPEDDGPRLYRRVAGLYAASTLPDGVTPASLPEPEPEPMGTDVVAALRKEDEDRPEPVDPAERQSLLQDLRFLDDL